MNTKVKTMSGYEIAEEARKVHVHALAGHHCVICGTPHEHDELVHGCVHCNMHHH